MLQEVENIAETRSGAGKIETTNTSEDRHRSWYHQGEGEDQIEMDRLCQPGQDLSARRKMKSMTELASN